MRSITILVSALATAAGLVMAPAASAAVGNHADVDASAEGSAAAVCQVLVIVNAVLVLGLEDGLGLVAPEPPGPARVRAPATAVGEGSVAECRAVVGRVDVSFADGRDGAGALASYVSGPPAVTASGGGVLIEESRLGSGSEIAVCQVLVVVASIIIGGGAYGFPTGAAARPLVVTGGDASAECEAAVGPVRSEGVA